MQQYMYLSGIAVKKKIKTKLKYLQLHYFFQKHVTVDTINQRA